MNEYEYAKRPYRIVGVDGSEVAMARFTTLNDAEHLVRGMNQLRENWEAKSCRAPYRVQVCQWLDVLAATP